MKCSFDPMIYKDMPIGQMYCPNCGVMVIAGMEHPDICFCSGEADYQSICGNCTPGWDKELFKE